MPIRYFGVSIAVLILILAGGYYTGFLKKEGIARMFSVPDMPDLERAIPTNSTQLLSTEARASILEKLNTTITVLKSTPKSHDHWLALGGYRQALGDYEGAKEAWEYVTRIAPDSSVAFANLGYIEMTYFEDFEAAEKNYMKALELDPKDNNSYRSLFGLYSNQYKKDTNAGEVIIQKGIAANENSYDLQVILGRYYVEKNRIADAKVQYQAAIKSAQARDLAEVAAQIEADLALLPAI